MSSNKRKFTQDDLRKAMSAHKKKKLGSIKKINSPLAKYTDSGQLMCILCKMVIRDELMWSIHLYSKIHKDTMELAKRAKLQMDKFAYDLECSGKRSCSPSEDTSVNKKIKGILKNSTQTMPQTNSNLPEDFFDNKEQEQAYDLSVPIQKLKNKNSIGNTNADTQNVEVEEEKEREKEKEKVMDSNPAALPEGFFDDPVMDAKVRNVEYKNPFDVEWELFQKEIMEETAQSAQIIADDQEEATTKRQMEEIEEQMRHWSRIMELVKCLEQVQNAERKQENIDDEDSTDEDEVDFEECFDWRAKDSYK